MPHTTTDRDAALGRAGVLALALVLLAPLAGGAPAVRAENRRLDPVSFARGLDVETVTALHQDRAGFVWIGTRQGLILYDGHAGTIFEHDLAAPESLSDNVVRTVYEDRDGRLWVGTNAGGLERLDRASGTFRHHRHDSADPTTISHDSVNVVLQDRDGALWVGTQIGLNRLDPASGVFERIAVDAADPAALGHAYVYALHEDRDGALWVGTVGGGVYRRDPDSGRFAGYRHDPSLPTAASRDDVFAIAEDASGRLWLGTERGLSVLEPGARRPVPVPHAGAEPPLVTCLALAPDGVLWIGTWGDGVLGLDTRTKRVVPPALARSSGSNPRVAALLVDRVDALWAGTWEGGLYRAPPSPQGFAALGPEQGLPVADATAVAVDRDGRLWVGTWGGGLAGQTRPGGPFDVRIPSLSDGTVLALADDRDGRLWVGTMEGLFRVDPATEAVEAWRHDPSDAGGLGPGYVTAILQDTRGTVWVGLGGSGLHRMRPDGSGFDRFVHDPGDPASLSENYVRSLAEDRSGTLWVGTRSGGLNAMDRDRGRFLRYLQDPADPGSLSYHYITGIVEDRDGTLWVATAGGGLNRARRTGDPPLRFERLTERQGLLDDNVRSLVLDRDGSLWLGTGQGLSRFDPASGAFHNYGPSGELPLSGFNVGAASVGPDALFLGTSRGVLVVPRDMPFTPPNPSPVVLRSIRGVARPIAASRPPWTLDRLEVAWGDLLTFEFAVLDYDDARRHRFAYRLDGGRGDWVALDDRRSITFTDLDPGTYDLAVRGRNAEGVWSETPAPLRLVVVPPFWMTTWFRVVVLAAVVGLALAAHRLRTSALERRNRELLRLKEQRERALAEARQSQEALHDAYGRLRRLTRRLELAKEEERKRIARELHDEMGQALTAAKINLQLLAQDPANGASRIEDTVGLVDRMIQHVRALSLDLRPPLLDELGLGAALRGYLEAQSQRTGLDVRIDADALPAGLPPEVEITTFRTIQEALTNVVRHAAAGRVDVQVRRGDGRILVNVRDDGRGFDVEHALERAAGGRHLGLLGIRERVEGLGGSIEIRSRPGRGAEVRISVPMNP